MNERREVDCRRRLGREEAVGKRTGWVENGMRRSSSKPKRIIKNIMCDVTKFCKSIQQIDYSVDLYDNDNDNDNEIYLFKPNFISI